MLRTLKRRSDAISRDDFPASNPPTNSYRRQRSASASSSASLPSNSDDNPSDPESQSLTQARTTHATSVRKLVRLALATEYARQPLRRSDISTKIFKEAGVSGRGFKGVFSEAQRTLERVFGMRLVELPGREKMGIKERRVAATQTQATATQMGKRGKGKGKESQGVDGQGAGAGAGVQGKSWILVSVLPEKYKNNPEIVRPSKAPSQDIEAGYTALYTFVVSVVYLNGNELAEGKLERYMEQVNVGRETEWGSWEKVLARMVREGYLDRKREEGEGWVYVVGPRGKIEVGTRGVQGLVKSVYGVGGGVDGEEVRGEGEGEGNGARTNGKMDEDELNKRLTRSLGVSVREKRENLQVVGGAAEEGGNEEQPEPQQRQRSGRRRAARDDDDDDD